MMDRPLLFGGCIIAVVILVGAGLIPVAGYHSVSSSSKNSPLFEVRTKRALNQESRILTYEYLKKGELFLVPARGGEFDLIQRIVEVIRGLSEEEFNKIIGPIVHQSGEIHNEDAQKIMNRLSQIRCHSDGIQKFLYQGTQDKLYTEEGCETVGFIWVQECWLVLLWLIISPMIWLILSLATMLLNCS